MIRSDVMQMDNMTAVEVASVDAVTIAPVRALHEMLAQIAVDASANAAEYLNETKVPYGGE